MGRKVNSQKTEPTGTLNFTIHTVDDIRLDSVGITNNNPNNIDYFSSNANKGADNVT